MSTIRDCRIEIVPQGGMLHYRVTLRGEWVAEGWTQGSERDARREAEHHAQAALEARDEAAQNAHDEEIRR